jgi:DNA-binding PadR family transcriptional regulator
MCPHVSAWAQRATPSTTGCIHPANHDPSAAHAVLTGDLAERSPYVYNWVLLVPYYTSSTGLTEWQPHRNPCGAIVYVPKKTTREVDGLLPLKPALFLILLALTDGDRHGYSLKKEILRRTDGRVKLGAGTLYRSIRQLVDLGLIEESNERPDPALDDERRRYFRLTGLGRQAARAETERLAALVRVAQSSRLAG